jgi:hypothetical protein
MMRTMIEHLSRMSERSPSYRLDPHLSLLYADLSREAAREQASRIEGAPDQVLLSRVQLVHPRGDQGWVDMSDLEIWADLPLGR